MKRTTVEGLLVLSLITGFSMPGWAQQPDIGKLEYVEFGRPLHRQVGRFGTI